MDKKLWLQQLTGKAAAQQEDEKALNQKQAVLSQLWADVTLLTPRQQANLDLQVSDGKKKQKLVDQENRDQTEEFDLDELQDGFALENDDDLRKLASALNTTEQWVERLKSQKKKVKVKKKNERGE